MKFWKRIKLRCVKRRNENIETWYLKYNGALNRLWAKFIDMPISEFALRWLERNHKRLMKIAENKWKK